MKNILLISLLSILILSCSNQDNDLLVLINETPITGQDYPNDIYINYPICIEYYENKLLIFLHKNENLIKILNADNGKEINVNLTNWNINIFPGQELIIYFVENSKKNKKIPYMIKNKSTSEVTNNVQEMYKEFFYTSYFKLIIPFLLIISYFMSSISVAIMSFVLYVIIRRRIGKDFFSEIKRKRLKKEDIMGLEHVI